MTPRYKLMVTASYGDRPPHAPVLIRGHGRRTLTWSEAVTEFQRSVKLDALHGYGGPIYDGHGVGGLIYLVVPA